MAVVEIGQPSESENRNPIGWILFFALVLLMALSQLFSYLDRSPSMDITRAEIVSDLEGRPNSSSGPAIDKYWARLEQDAQKLHPNLAGSAENALLYAAVRTEQGAKIQMGEVAALKTAKEPFYRAAYQIYASPNLTLPQAEDLSSKIPQTSFLNKLVRAQALEKAGQSSAREALGNPGRTSRVVLLGTVGVLLVVGIWLIVGYVVFRKNDGATPLGLPLGRLSGPDADRVALRSAQVFLAFLFGSFVAGQVLRHFIPDRFVELPTYLAVIGLVLVLFKLPAGGKLISPRALGISRDQLGKHVLWGLGGAIANVPILIVVQLIAGTLLRGLPTPEHPITVEITDTRSILVLVQIAFVASVLAPFVEEIMFRGTLFPALTSVIKSPVWAALISSLCFAMIHPTGIPVWPGLAAIGCMSCFLTYQTRSLVPSMVMHGAHNFATLIFTIVLLR